jgi:uncharacterized protein (UPF0303 family)
MASQGSGDLLATLEEQERRLVFPSFGYEDAWRLGTVLVELGRERHAPVAIDIRCGLQQLFHCALPGSTADNDAWIDRKRGVVARYAESSYLVGERFRVQGTEASRLDPDRYAAHGGAFPVRLSPDGPVVGTITVSGLPQAEDHRLIVEGLERYLGAGAP